MNIVRAFLDASIRRDWTRAGELVEPDVELHGTVGGVGEGRVYRGLAEVVREYDEVDGEAWEERRVEPEEFLDAEDEVVVLFHEYRRGRGSGVELEIDTAAVFKVRDGRVVRIQGNNRGLRRMNYRAGSLPVWLRGRERRSTPDPRRPDSIRQAESNQYPARRGGRKTGFRREGPRSRNERRRQTAGCS